MASLLKIFLLSMLIVGAMSCTGGGDDGDDDDDDDYEESEEPEEEEDDEPTDEPTDEPDDENDDPVEKCLGEGAKDSLTEFINGEETEAASGEDLACDFSGATCECWANNVDDDQLDWVVGDEADPDAIEECFPDTDANIEGEYLVIFSQDGENRKDKAVLQSCTLECVKSAKISMDVLIKNADLQVCMKSKEDSQANPVCQDVFDSGRTTVDLAGPEGEDIQNTEIWLVAEGLGPSSLIVVDNVEVETVPCGDESTEAPPVTDGGETTPTGDTPETTGEGETTPSEGPDESTSEGGDPCALACDFESDCASYEAVPEGTDGTTATWEKSVEKIGNRDTGIRQTSTGTEGNFAGTELQQEGSSAMKVSGLSGTAGKKIKIKYYDATKDLQFKVCKDAAGSECLFESEKGVQVSDREWKETEITLEETEELYFVCVNESDDIGCCGVDTVTVLDESGADACSG